MLVSFLKLTKSVAFGYDQSDDRFVFDKTGATSKTMTSIGADAFFIHVHTNAGTPDGPITTQTSTKLVTSDINSLTIYIYTEA